MQDGYLRIFGALGHEVHSVAGPFIQGGNFTILGLHGAGYPSFLVDEPSDIRGLDSIRFPLIQFLFCFSRTLEPGFITGPDDRQFVLLHRGPLTMEPHIYGYRFRNRLIPEYVVALSTRQIQRESHRIAIFEGQSLPISILILFITDDERYGALFLCPDGFELHIAIFHITWRRRRPGEFVTLPVDYRNDDALCESELLGEYPIGLLRPSVRSGSAIIIGFQSNRMDIRCIGHLHLDIGRLHRSRNNRFIRCVSRYCGDIDKIHLADLIGFDDIGLRFEVRISFRSDEFDDNLEFGD